MVLLHAMHTTSHTLILNPLTTPFLPPLSPPGRRHQPVLHDVHQLGVDLAGVHAQVLHGGCKSGGAMRTRASVRACSCSVQRCVSWFSLACISRPSVCTLASIASMHAQFGQLACWTVHAVGVRDVDHLTRHAHCMHSTALEPPSGPAQHAQHAPVKPYRSPPAACDAWGQGPGGLLQTGCARPSPCCLPRHPCPMRGFPRAGWAA